MSRAPIQLTEDEQMEYTKKFMEIDTARNGWLSRGEIGDWLRGAGYSLTEKEVENIFRTIDANSDGRITLDEFYVAMRLIKGPPSKTADVHRVFKAMDTNGDGVLSEDELYEGLNKCGYNFTRDQIKKMISNLDKNGDGLIDIDEFMAAFD